VGPIAIITGSGTYSLPGLEASPAQPVKTAFGEAMVSEGTFAGADVLHVARHGDGHRRISSQVDHRANIAALAARGASAVLGVTVCGSLDPELELGSLIVFDDLHFLVNRLPDGSICTLHTEPGAPGRGHWIFDSPFASPLRGALIEGAHAAGPGARDGGCYGHVDGPRFNTRAELRMLRACGVTAVSQTAGPETVLCGEAKLPYALLGYATDYANGVSEEPTPVEELIRLVGASTESFARTLAAAVPLVAEAGPVEPTGTHFSWDGI
jgi:purine nucleoside phosphorylase